MLIVGKSLDKEYIDTYIFIYSLPDFHVFIYVYIVFWNIFTILSLK